MALSLPRRRFTVDEYHRMADAGILAEDDRVELLDGEIVQMSPIGRRHAACVRRLISLFSQAIGSRALLDVQNPLLLDSYNEPEPDVMLLRPRSDFYASGHPGAQDVLLIVEVADTSAETDRQVKVPLYARSGIPEVWLVDLAQDHIAVYQEPGAEGYRTVRIARRGEVVAPRAFPDLSFAVESILGVSP